MGNNNNKLSPIHRKYNGLIYRNQCDGCRSLAEIFTTSICPNKCRHCIAERAMSRSNHSERPNYDKIIDSLKGIDTKYLSFSGGEPLLFIDEVIKISKWIKANKGMEIFVATSLPQIPMDKLVELLDTIDYLNISVQSNRTEVADSIRGTVSTYDRNEFIKRINDKYKDKIQISFLLLNGDEGKSMNTKEEVTECIDYYYDMGFRRFKMSEVSGPYYISFNDIMGTKLWSAYSAGCEVNVNKLFNKLDADIILRRRCFKVERKQYANILDLIKIFIKRFILRRLGRDDFYLIRYDGKVFNNYNEVEVSEE